MVEPHGQVPATPDPGPLAKRLDFLFRTVQPLGREFKYSEVVEAMQKLGYNASTSMLQYLRTGQRRNCNRDYYLGLAKVFGVRVEYFFDDEESGAVDEELAFLATLRDKGVRSIAFRSATWTPDARQLLQQIMDGIEMTNVTTQAVSTSPPIPSTDAAPSAEPPD